jgi:anti-anti-sigma factor
VLSGELDRETAAELEELVVRLSADGTDAVTLDLRQLHRIDVSGVRVVVLACVLCESDGFDFQLIAGAPPLQRIFARCGVLELLPFRAAS